MLGGGGREHALAWKLAQSPGCSSLFAAPGNPGIAEHATLVDLDLARHDSVVAFCRAQGIGLVVIGPEAPLVDGLADSLRAANIPVFGPSAAAAQLEGSKGFTKDLCRAAGIPTAAYVRCTDAATALTQLDAFTLPVVIKADGLAAGKGVIIAATRAEAEAAIADMFGGSFGASGAEVVIEEFLEGEEASFFALTDGKHVVPFGSAQDHKRVGDGDTGPNTGGMGAYSPASVLTPALEREVMAKMIRPTVAAMAARGMPYSGVLFAGLMLTADGPKLIEYNCRFGDPECQVLMMRLEGDLVELLLSVAQGYPGMPEKGGAITLPATGAEGHIFQAGTALAEGRLVANGGRVLSVTARGNSVTGARDGAYAMVDAVDYADGFCRRDIGWREIAREAAAAI